MLGVVTVVTGMRTRGVVIKLLTARGAVRDKRRSIMVILSSSLKDWDIGSILEYDFW